MNKPVQRFFRKKSEQLKYFQRNLSYFKIGATRVFVIVLSFMIFFFQRKNSIQFCGYFYRHLYNIDIALRNIEAFEDILKDSKS